MSTDPLRLAVIIGSTRKPRIGEAVADWFVGRCAHRKEFVVDLIDLAEVDLPAVLPRHAPSPVRSYVARIDTADAFVMVTPEYNHGYPASVKQAIDVAGREWAAKPVGFVSYGGISGGIRAVEQLRQVFPEVDATTVRRSVAFPKVWGLLDDHGGLRDSDFAEAAAEQMLDQLVWWGTALRNARHSDTDAAA